MVVYGQEEPSSVDLAYFHSYLGLTIVGANSLDSSGISVSSIGDFNNDGYDDLAIGASGASGLSKTKSGNSYILFGGYNTPTGQPTNQPSTQPSAQPTGQPTIQPTGQPIAHPSAQPSEQPTVQPSSQPAAQPSYIPSSRPSAVPTKIHSKSPTEKPIIYPTSQPSAQPSGQPTGQPSNQPTKQPILAPTSQPTIQPSAHPSVQPTSQPTNPTGQPTDQPSGKPSGQPTLQPTSPTGQPTATPTILEKELSNFVDLGKLTHYQGITVNGKVSYDASGSSVSSAGDFDGDGFADAIIGSSQASPFGRTNAGSVVIVYGSYGHATPSSINLANHDYRITEIYGANPGDQCGIVVTNAGDINGDGYDDIIISCSQASYNGLPGSGAVFIIYGGKNIFSIDLQKLEVSQGFAIYGANSYDNFGFSISALGDINGDGYADFAASSPQASPNAQTNAGIVYTFLGGQTQIDIYLSNPSSSVIQINGANAGDYFGYRITKGADFDKDGRPEIVASAIYASDNNLINSGTTNVISSKLFDNLINNIINLSDLSANQLMRVFGKNAGDNSGYSLVVGDYNGDSKSDLIIGSPNALNQAGIISILYNFNFSDINLVSYTGSLAEIYGANPGDNIGKILAIAGHINGGKCEAIILGIPQSSYLSRNKCGKSIVVYGQEEPSSVDLAYFHSYLGLTIVGANPLDSSGISVSSIGDFNNDGHDDLAIGASGASGLSKTKSGNSYILFGGYNTPTGQPTGQPTLQPFAYPSSEPSIQPTSHPSSMPSSIPTAGPTESSIPTLEPTAVPTILPTVSDHSKGSKHSSKSTIIGSAVGITGGLAIVGCVVQGVLYDIAKEGVARLFKMVLNKVNGKVAETDPTVHPEDVTDSNDTPKVDESPKTSKPGSASNKVHPEEKSVDLEKGGDIEANDDYPSDHPYSDDLQFSLEQESLVQDYEIARLMEEGFFGAAFRNQNHLPELPSLTPSEIDCISNSSDSESSIRSADFAYDDTDECMFPSSNNTYADEVVESHAWPRGCEYNM